MATIWEKHKGYIPALKYVNLTTRTCFRSIRIEGAERIPQEGAVILAPNHCAALMASTCVRCPPTPRRAHGIST